MAFEAAGLISSVTPLGVACAEVEDSGQPLPLHPEEAGHVANAADKRRRDFAAGRFCARSALAQMGLADAVVSKGARGEPLWPAGIVGSITHTRGYAAALVADKRRFLAIGLDAEHARDMTDDLAPRLFDAGERARLKTLEDAERRLAATILFSAKEAYFKAWSPLTGKPLAFQALHVDLEEEGFVITQPNANLDDWKEPVRGRFAVRAGLVVTAICLPRSASS